MKRKRQSHAQIKARKQQRLDHVLPSTAGLDDSVLRLHYPIVQSLRSYLLSLTSPPKKAQSKHTAQNNRDSANDLVCEEKDELDVLLDSTFVGSFDGPASSPAIIEVELAAYNQTAQGIATQLLSCEDPSAQSQVGSSGACTATFGTCHSISFSICSGLPLMSLGH